MADDTTDTAGSAGNGYRRDREGGICCDSPCPGVDVEDMRMHRWYDISTSGSG